MQKVFLRICPAQIIAILLEVAFSLYTVSALAQTPAMWNGLPKGAYEVGFQFERQYDHARPFQNKYAENGKIVKDRARPIQMFIWYPAARGANSKPLQYEEYLLLNDTEAEPWRWTDAQKRALRQNDGEEKQLSGASWEAILALETAAVKDAKAAGGKFPLVIFGMGGGTGGHVYSVLCEYLASHGYVAVALTALPLRKGERWPFDASGIDAQMRDLEFAINYAYRLPFVDADKLALASWSVGGVTQALLQMRNSDVDALLSLDAATGYEYGRDLLKQSIFLDFKKMNVPYLHMHGEGPVRYNVPKNFEYFDSLAVADAYLLTFKQMTHADFLPCYGAVPHTILKTERSPTIVAGFQVVGQYVLNFLNAYLRGDKTSLEFLHNDPVSNGLSNAIGAIQTKRKRQAQTRGNGFVQVNGGKLYFEIAGEGCPLVLIGGGSMDLRQWDEQFKFFQQSFKAIRYDPRGVGKSDSPSASFSHVEDLEALLDFLGVDKAVLLGLSSGGGIALDFALTHSQRVLGLVLSAPVVHGYKFSVEQQQRVASFASAAQSGAEAYVKILLEDSFFIPAPQNPEARKRAQALIAENFRPFDFSLIKQLDPPTITRLAEIDKPVLLLIGSLDHPDVQKRTAFLEQAIRGAKRVTIKNAGHLVNLEAPDGFNQAAYDFFVVWNFHKKEVSGRQ